MTGTVELLPAFLWVCDVCGRDNFERCRRIEPESLEAAELQAFAEEFKIHHEGDFLESPGEVKCAYCGAEFDVDFSEE